MFLAGFLFLTFFVGFYLIKSYFQEHQKVSKGLKSVAQVQMAKFMVPVSRRASKAVPVIVKLEDGNMCWDSIDLLAVCVLAEAEGESELGKRLVIDTVLNRAAHPEFPNTIQEVISYPNAFTSYWDGRMDEAEPSQEIYRLISEEMRNRTNEKVLYFAAGHWPEYGSPLVKEGGHCFSG